MAGRPFDRLTRAEKAELFEANVKRFVADNARFVKFPPRTGESQEEYVRRYLRQQEAYAERQK